LGEKCEKRKRKSGGNKKRIKNLKKGTKKENMGSKREK
jgi:hypothetical protein